MTTSPRRVRSAIAIAGAALIAAAGSFGSSALAASNAAKTTSIAVKAPGKPMVACESKRTPQAQAACVAKPAAKKAAKVAEHAANKAAHKAATKTGKHA